MALGLLWLSSHFSCNHAGLYIPLYTSVSSLPACKVFITKNSPLLFVTFFSTFTNSTVFFTKWRGPQLYTVLRRWEYQRPKLNLKSLDKYLKHIRNKFSYLCCTPYPQYSKIKFYYLYSPLFALISSCLPFYTVELRLQIYRSYCLFKLTVSLIQLQLEKNTCKMLLTCIYLLKRNVLFQLSTKFHLCSIFTSSSIVSQNKMRMHTVEHCQFTHGIRHRLVWSDHLHFRDRGKKKVLNRKDPLS